jgi:hypothetical protein
MRSSRAGALAALATIALAGLAAGCSRVHHKDTYSSQGPGGPSHTYERAEDEKD